MPDKVRFIANRGIHAVALAAACALLACIGGCGDPPVDLPRYTVTYDSNGATRGTVPAPQKVKDSSTPFTVSGNTGGLMNAPSAGTAEAFKFGGWNTEAEGTGDEYAVGNAFTVAADITLYVKWVAFEPCDIGPGGGMVFHDKGSFSDSWRYLETAPASTENAGIAWWSDTSTPTNATAQGIGYGSSNTETIIGALGTSCPDYAALVCNTMSFGGYSDWFLPSPEELQRVFDVLWDSETYRLFHEEDYYWTSSESSVGDAYYMRFSDAYTASSGTHAKTLLHRVRAARAF